MAISAVKTHKEPMIDDRQAARRLGMSVQTLRNMRHERRGPVYHKMGRAIRYEIDELENYIEAGRIDPAAR